ncbi:hypothetical protein QT15_21125 [Pseudoalteromonas flavipulchra NCIMB 2033 = ATCC BAA-314]|nr:hypothetical protein QT15_21125 [Pseudoalteromonas flavipulchra NCIMB 2033 = ATCC BAA-314]
MFLASYYGAFLLSFVYLKVFNLLISGWLISNNKFFIVPLLTNIVPLFSMFDFGNDVYKIGTL